VQSFRLFQSRVLEIYDSLVEEFGLRPIDATGEIAAQQQIVRRMAGEILCGYDRPHSQWSHDDAQAK
jgi:dTMP kinase